MLLFSTKRFICILYSYVNKCQEDKVEWSHLKVIPKSDYWYLRKFLPKVTRQFNDDIDIVFLLVQI